MVSDLLRPGVHRAQELLDDRAVVCTILAVEDAWVAAQHREGLVSAEEAAAAHAAVDRVGTDPHHLRELVTASEGGGNPVIPVLGAYRRAVEQVLGRPLPAVHASLTSQDVMDTALAHLLSSVRRRVVGDLTRAGDALAELVRRHRGTPMVARTLTQHALPTTFGLKAAGWLAAVDDAADEVSARARLPLSCGGAAGTLAATVALVSGTAPGAQGAAHDQPLDPTQRLLHHWAGQLGLEVPDAPWHTTRTPVVRAAGALAEVAAAVSRLANDVLLLSRPEIGDLREPTAPGRGASSAMPQKQNPVLSVLLKRTALLAPGLASGVLAGAGAAVDERPDDGWHAEWPALGELAELTAAAASHAAELAEGLTVDAPRMARNLADAGTGVLAEPLAVALAPVLGERGADTARQLVRDAVRAEPHDVGALTERLAEAVAASDGAVAPPGVDARSTAALAAWLGPLTDPRAQLGAAPQLCDRAVARHDERRNR
ncbi:lyase family protein [Kocuria rhizophila]|uniref:lyase family protein n=1 Tax=Kocuria rhizophila TaxID=72000 RepID=UPI0021B16D73|nr:lyase family protein [Kocuria rhizophila]